MWLSATIDPTDPPGPRRGWSEDRPADQASIRRVARGDTEALAELYDRHARAIFSLALRIVERRADAEDVVQEVFAQVWAQAARYDPGRGPLSAWLLTIARSRAIDRLRASRARPEAGASAERAIDALRDPAIGQETAMLSDEQVARLRAALAGLPPVQRVAIELAYYEGLSQREIAARLDQPLGTVKTRIRLALLKLREALAEAGT